MKIQNIIAAVLLSATTACSITSEPPTRDAAIPTTRKVAPSLEENEVKALSHSLLKAYDHMEDASFAESIGETFALVEGGEITDRESLLKGLRDRRDRHAPVRSRAWGEEHVSIGTDVAVFIGTAVEHIPRDPGQPSWDFEGWNTLIWVRQNERWKAAHWQWQRGGLDAQRAEWNWTYRQGKDFNIKPNQLLVDVTKGRKPGTALDVAMGQGRNAIYLASKGWKVTGIDISDEGLHMAQEGARKRGLRIDTINANMDTWDFGSNQWELVALIYAGGDPSLIAKVQVGLKKGGLFVAEAYAIEDSSGPGIQIGQLAELFKDGYAILQDDVVEDIADWGLQKSKLVRFVAQKN